MPAPIFHDDPDDGADDVLGRMLRDKDEVSRRARSALARFERPDTIGAGEGRGAWGSTWLLLAVGRWRVLAVETAALGIAILVLFAGRADLLPSVGENGPLLLAVVGLVALGVCLGVWSTASLGGWVDEHNARVERIRCEVKAERDLARTAAVDPP